SGSGLVRPYYPGDDADTVRLSVRLVDSRNSTLTESILSLPIVRDNDSDDDDAPATLVYFDVQPRNPSVGDTVTVSWKVENVEHVSLFWFHNQSRAMMPVNSSVLGLRTDT